MDTHSVVGNELTGSKNVNIYKRDRRQRLAIDKHTN